MITTFAHPSLWDESPSNDEATLRARNIPYIPPRDFDSAYELTQAIEQATTQQTPREVPVFGDPLWIERTKPKTTPGRCIIEVNGKRV
jgi:hypothetical protein